MKVVLLGKHFVSHVTLPKKIYGQHRLSENREKIDRGRELYIEADENRWVIKKNDTVDIIADSANLMPEAGYVVLEEKHSYEITFLPSMEKAMLLTEAGGADGMLYYKYSVPHDGIITVGNRENALVVYNNPCIKGQLDMSVIYRGQEINVINNGTGVAGNAGHIYLNGRYADRAVLHYGDVLYVYGLQIIIGRRFISVNNPGRMAHFRLHEFILPKTATKKRRRTGPNEEEKYFSSSPKKERKIRREEIRVEAPPRPETDQDTPLYLAMGPSITMAGASGVTGLYSTMNIVQNNGDIMQAMPSLVMVASMMLGSIIWPFFSRRYTKRKRLEKDADHYERYQNYIRQLREQTSQLIVQQEEKLRANYPALLRCENRIIGREPSLWERSMGDSDFLELSLGIGRDDLKCDIHYPSENMFEASAEIMKLLHQFKNEEKFLKDVPITYSFYKHPLTGITGERNLVKQFVFGLVLQMVSLHGYDDLKIGVIHDKNEPEWECMKWLPHCWSDDRMIKYMADTPEELNSLSAHIELIRSIRMGMSDEELTYEAPYYVFILAGQRLAEKSEVIKEMYKERKAVGISIILLYDEQKALPKTCKNVLEVREEGVVAYDYTDDDREARIADNSMFYREDPEKVFKSLADVRLDVVANKSALPEQITLFEMLGIGKPRHMDFMNRWKNSNSTKSLAVPIGVDSEGSTVYLDIHEKAHGPHGLIAGSTGSGKSEFIISYITMLALNFSPEDVAFILIDFKGGGMADVFKNLPHLAGSITNLDGNELKRSLVAIETELEKRQKLFKKTSNELKISNIDIYRYQQLYRERRVKTPLPHLVIISDEFAELKQQQPDFLEQLIRTARIGRSLGVHLILATQKPDGVVDDQIKSNIKFKICLRVQDKMDSISMIDRPDAATIRVSGRFYLQVGMNELFVQGQSPFSGAEYEETDIVTRRVDDSIVVFNGLDRISIKPGNAGGRRTSEKQIDALLAYVSEISRQNDYGVKPLWREQLPGPKGQKEKVYSDKQQPYVLNPVVGQYDDLRNREYRNLSIPISDEGNVLVYGAAGSGTLEFLNAMAYFLIGHHSPDELRLYLLDFEAGALKAFACAPQVMDVVQGYEEKKFERVLEFLSVEIENRKKQFSRYGGSYHNYIRNSGNTMPNIVVMMLNCAVAFEESSSYDRMQHFIQLSREGAQYGVYFVVTAVDERSVRSQLAANFKQVFVLQQNKEDTYRDILGKTDGLIPAPYLGRGIFKRGGIVYEFQTKIMFEEETEPFTELEKYCIKMRKKYGYAVKETLPVEKILTEKDFEEEWKNASCKAVPLGGSADGEKVCWDISSNVKHLIVSENAEEEKKADCLLEYICRICPDTQVWRGGMSQEEAEKIGEKINLLYSDILRLSEEGVRAKQEGKPLPDFSHKIIVIRHYDALMRQLPAEQNQTLRGILSAISSGYHIHFVFMNQREEMDSYYNEEIWKLPEENGIWLGESKKAAEIFSCLTEDCGVEMNIFCREGKGIAFRLPERRE